MHVVGIDLGTSTSVVALVNRGSRQVLTRDERDRLLPTVVAIDARGRFSVGSNARDSMEANPEFTFFGLKRIIGRKFADPVVQDWAGVVPYGIVEGPDGWAYLQGPQELHSPIELLGKVFRELRDIASGALNERIEDAVIGVPAYFDQVQKQAMRQAAEAGGFNARRLLPEPTAAAVAYGVDRSVNRVIAVYDFGGGTFDVSILQIRGQAFHALATSGDPLLGGDDIDRRIVDFAAEEVKREYGVDLRDDYMARARLRMLSENAKLELTSVEGTRIQAKHMADKTDERGHTQHVHINVELTRDKLEELVVDLIDRTRAPCHEAMQRAKKDMRDIQDVVLVGGMTRMPIVGATVADIFGQTPRSDVDPLTAVAYGCAAQGAVMAGTFKSLALQERSTKSIGVEVGNGSLVPIIRAGSTIPNRVTMRFGMADKNVDGAAIRVFEGDLKVASDNREVARLVLNDLQASRAKRGDLLAEPTIDLTFDINEEGICEFTAVNAHAKEKAVSYRVHADTGLSEEEVSELRRLGDLEEDNATDQAAA